jgi:hypothetical protein
MKSPTKAMLFMGRRPAEIRPGNKRIIGSQMAGIVSVTVRACAGANQPTGKLGVVLFIA